MLETVRTWVQTLALAAIAALVAVVGGSPAEASDSNPQVECMVAAGGLNKEIEKTLIALVGKGKTEIL